MKPGFNSSSGGALGVTLVRAFNSPLAPFPTCSIQSHAFSHRVSSAAWFFNFNLPALPVAGHHLSTMSHSHVDRISKREHRVGAVANLNTVIRVATAFDLDCMGLSISCGNTT